MVYLSWDRDAIHALPTHWHEYITEVDEAGIVWREVAADQAGIVVYRAPSQEHPRGMFENQRIKWSGDPDPMLEERFLQLWNRHGEDS
jgi:hypothetical protein